MKKFIKTLAATGLALSIIPAAAMAGTDSNAPATAAKAPSKNLIVLIGDGMGPAQVSAARDYVRHFMGKQHLELDSYYVGQATTYADKGMDGGTYVSGEVTDSASAGTAFATGHKTYNAGISVSNEDISKPFASIIEAAEKLGKATGLVTTARITHATPAVYASHVRNRDNESAIATQYLKDGDVDVLFGGGKQFFVTKAEKGKRTDQNIIPAFEQKGYKVVYDKQGLQSLDAKSGKALGLFGSSHVDYVPDRTDAIPSLAEMTKKAIDILSTNDKGFTMMIEGGRIDHAGHANDLPTTIQETLDFDAAVKVAMDFAKKDGNTSVVITADHETGGLSLSRDGVYEINVDGWNKQKHSSEAIASKLKAAKTPDEIKALVKENIGLDLSDEEAQYIMKGDGSSYAQEGAYNAVVAKYLMVGFTGHGHSAVDVGVWAYGPIADKVKGQVDNTDIAKASADIIGADLAAATAEMQAKYFYPMFKVARDGNVMYPARALATQLGAKVEWDAASGSAKITKGSQVITVQIESKEAKLNGAAAGFSADVDNGILYFPLAAFNQLAGMNMTWDSPSERLVLK